MKAKARKKTKPKPRRIDPIEVTPTPSDPPPPVVEQGLGCRNCGCRHMPVAYTRHRLRKIMRVRYCRHCGTRHVTWEQTTGGGA